MEFWISESEKIERRKKWKQDFQSIGQDVYSFFIDTAIEKGFESKRPIRGCIEISGCCM